MRRPNLARAPFLDVRSVWLASGALAVVAVVMTTMGVSQVLSARGEERALGDRLKTLEERRAVLVREVDAANRELAGVRWKKLQLETASMSEVVRFRRLMWTELLSDLERVVPWDVRLASIDPTVNEAGDVKLSLVGFAAGRDGWLHLLARLFSDDKFSDPIPQSEEAPGTTSGQGYRFHAQVNYWPGGRK